jgi:CRP-like cAMP-binding protein
LNAGHAKYYRVTREGEEVLLWSLRAGNVFGLATLVRDPGTSLGTAEALQDCDVIAWDRAGIRSLANTCPLLAENALRVTFQYLSAHADRLVRILTQTAEQRLARMLLNLGTTAGRVLPQGVEIEATNKDLSAMANVSRFTASRVMQKWERAGAVVKTCGKVRLRVPEKLLED